VKVLVYSDIHHGGGLRYGCIGEGGINSRLRASVEVERYLLRDVVEEYNVNAVWFLGDYVENSAVAHIDDFVRRGLIEALNWVNKKGVEVLILVGNHDRFFKGFEGFGDIFSLFEMNEKIRVLRGSGVVDVKGLKVGFLGFANNVEEGIERLSEEECDVVLVHRDIAGAVVFGRELKRGLSIEYLKSLKNVFAGHIHKPRRLSEGIWIVGSVRMIDMSDVVDGGERGYGIFDTDTGSFEMFATDRRLVRLEFVGGGVKDFLDLIERGCVECDCVVVDFKSNDESLFKELVKRREECMRRFGLENLVLVFSGVRVVSVVGSCDVVGLGSRYDRLKSFVAGADVGALDRMELVDVGLEVLRSVEGSGERV
ncbi:MAG: metallophosphoesterase, partial [Candidatus Freyarchaeota archaeon]|nr:metallophosphoesterase [Candidatus Jordarchaeia archaeon]